MTTQSNNNINNINNSNNNNQLDDTISQIIERTVPNISLSGEITLKLNEILASLSSIIKAKTKEKVFKLVLPNNITLNYRSSELSNFYSENYFEDYYNAAFGTTWPPAASLMNNPQVVVKFSSLTKKQNNQKKSILSYAGAAEFRPLTCLLFSIVHNIKLNSCICYPLNLIEQEAWATGLYKNCYNSECQGWLATYPALVDSLFMGNCTDQNQTAFLIFIQRLASKSVNVKLILNDTLAHLAKNSNQSS